MDLTCRVLTKKFRWGKVYAKWGPKLRYLDELQIRADLSMVIAHSWDQDGTTCLQRIVRDETVL